MSTLKVATIQDTSGNNSSTPAGIASGTAKAWVNFNGTGTFPTGTSVIRDSFNVAAISDHSTADYTILFTNGMTSGHYAVAGAVSSTSAIMPEDVFLAIRLLSWDQARISCCNAAGVAEDGEVVSVVVFGNLYNP